MEPYTPYDAASRIQDKLVFGEFGDVNPSIADSSTYTFLTPGTMRQAFEGAMEGCFLYSRHWNPTNKYLAEALGVLEDTPAAHVAASGIASIACSILQLCSVGDHIVCARTIYGGTYALIKNLLPRLGIEVTFVDIQDLAAVESAIGFRTRLVYCESISNPLLEVADIRGLAAIADKHDCKLVVDNTFSPLILTPHRLGAHAVIHSLTKFINGTSDCVAGCICAEETFIEALSDVNAGTCMLLGPVLDSYRAASILKNMHSLHVRIKQHSSNAQFLAEGLSERGYKVFYPGLPTHPGHQLMQATMNPMYGFGGMLALDVETAANADKVMTRMQEEKVGYLAVSLGYFKTLFSSPSASTSSEIPPDERRAIGLSDGLIRISVGLDEDIDRSLHRIIACLTRL
ncbi:MAG: aminotransferase class I/II-fold pyridoxal phosphate-dependent enzyme [Fimbriimonadaceae bacterium]